MLLYILSAILLVYRSNFELRPDRVIFKMKGPATFFPYPISTLLQFFFANILSSPSSRSIFLMTHHVHWSFGWLVVPLVGWSVGL